MRQGRRGPAKGDVKNKDMKNKVVRSRNRTEKIRELSVQHLTY